MELIAEDTDDPEVFEGNSTLSDPIFARTSSSSSSRKSSYEDGVGLGMDDKLSDQTLEDGQMELAATDSGDPMTSPLGPNPPTVVEWKPQEPTERDNVSFDAQQNGCHEPMNSDPLSSPRTTEDLKELYGSAVTVTIDPPLDDGQSGTDDAVARYLDGKESSHNSSSSNNGSSGCSNRSLAELFGKGEDLSTDFDLFESVNESDLADEEDSEPPPPTKICLLSK